jgi:hypothetical protein
MNSNQSCCRVCLTQDGIEEMQSIFENNCKIAFEIFLITQIKITEIIDELPALICRQCHKELLNAIKFRDKCQSSDVFFREKFFSIEKKFYGEEHLNNIKDESKESHVNLIEATEDLENVQIIKEDNLSEEKIKIHESTQCKLCFKNFTSVHSLKAHMRAIHQKLEETDMYRCQYCERLFKMKYYLSEFFKDL